MKTRLIPLLVATLFLVECSNNRVEKAAPGCVQTLIEQIKSQPVWNPAAKVYRYTYRGKTVYFVPQHCCDISSILYDESCNIICAPDGGISGAGDGKCTDFFAARTNEVLIWQDTRR